LLFRLFLLYFQNKTRTEQQDSINTIDNLVKIGNQTAVILPILSFVQIQRTGPTARFAENSSLFEFLSNLALRQP